MRQRWQAAEHSNSTGTHTDARTHTHQCGPVTFTSSATWRIQQEREHEYSMCARKMPQGYTTVLHCLCLCVCVCVCVCVCRMGKGETSVRGLYHKSLLCKWDKGNLFFVHKHLEDTLGILNTLSMTLSGCESWDTQNLP